MTTQKNSPAWQAQGSSDVRTYRNPSIDYDMPWPPACQEGNFNHAASLAADAYVAELEQAGSTPVVLPNLTMLEIALLHAGRGFRVFPVAWIAKNGGCSCWQYPTPCPTPHKPHRGCPLSECASPGKHPLHRGWQQEATSDPEAVTRLWASNPRANVGIVTEGRLALDVDPGKGGAESLQALEADNEPLETLTAITGSGGLHLLFDLPEGVRCKNRVGLAPGLDTRADGGFIVAAGSHHVSGERYRWQSSYHAPSVAPDWLIALCTPPEPVRAPVVDRPVTVPTSRIEAWGTRGLWAEVQQVKLTPEGQRFIALHKSAFRIGMLVAIGAVKESDAETDLLNAGAAMGLSDHEAQRAVEHGLRDGKRHPRKLPDWATEPTSTSSTPSASKGEPGRPAQRQERGGVVLSSGAAAAYDLLLEHIQACDPGGTPHCRLTVGQMAEQLGSKVRTVQGYMIELKDVGLVERRQTRHGCETTVLSGAPTDDDPSQDDDNALTFMSASNSPDMLDSIHDPSCSSLRSSKRARDFLPTLNSSAPNLDDLDTDADAPDAPQSLPELVADAVTAYGPGLAKARRYVAMNGGAGYGDVEVSRAYQTHILRSRLVALKRLSDVKTKLKGAEYHIDQKQYAGQSPAWWLWYRSEIAREVRRREVLAAEQMRLDAPKVVQPPLFVEPPAPPAPETLIITVGDPVEVGKDLAAAGHWDQAWAVWRGLPTGARRSALRLRLDELHAAQGLVGRSEVAA